MFLGLLLFQFISLITRGNIRNNLLLSNNAVVLALSYPFLPFKDENEGFFLAVKRLIEETYESNNQQPVIILCHSMGCTFSYIFLKNQSTEWKNRFVKTWIVIGAPFGGTYRYLYLYFADDDPPLASMFKRIRLAERTYSSVPFLLPRPSVFQNDVLVQTSSRNYTSLDYALFFQVTMTHTWLLFHQLFAI